MLGLIVVAVIGAVVGYAAYLYFSLQGDLQDPGITETDPPPISTDKDPPVNALLIGSDSRAGLTEEEQLKLGARDLGGGERADTLILAHIDPETEKVTTVQFPRDLYVPSAAGGKSKINETLDISDNNLIATVKDVTGLDIHHYAKVNIAGFRDLVDEIGGVEVCIPEPIPFDSHTGIEITADEVGMVEFDGERALRFVRSRNFPTGDLERIQNQQKFLAAAVDKITSPLTFLNLGRLLDLRDIAKENVRIDPQTTIAELSRILSRFRAFNPDNYEAYTAPNLGTGSAAGSSVILPDKAAMRVMFNAIEANRSPAEADGVPPIKTSSVSVGVYNATNKTGAADRAAEKLEQATTTEDGPVNVVTVGDAPRDFDGTTVVYRNEEQREKARLVAAALPGARLEESRTTPGIDVAVMVGKRFSTRKIVQLTPLELPTPGELPEECS